MLDGLLLGLGPALIFGLPAAKFLAGALAALLGTGYMGLQGYETFAETPKEKLRAGREKEQRRESLLANAMLAAGDERRESTARQGAREERMSRERMYDLALQQQSQVALVAALASMLGQGSADRQQVSNAVPSMMAMTGAAKGAAQGDVDRVLAASQNRGGWESLIG